MAAKFLVLEDGTAVDICKIIAVYHQSNSTLKVALEGGFTVMIDKHSQAGQSLQGHIDANMFF